MNFTKRSLVTGFKRRPHPIVAPIPLQALLPDCWELSHCRIPFRYNFNMSFDDRRMLERWDNLSAKERRQRFQLLRFAQSYPEFPLGTLDFGDKPDLIVRTVDVLGIEHTELMYTAKGAREGRLREVESLQERVIERAKELYDDYGGADAYVSVNFNRSKPLKKRSVDNVAVTLARVILQIAKCTTPENPLALIEGSLYRRLFGTGFPVDGS
jgi:hypothetical protein